MSTDFTRTDNEHRAPVRRRFTATTRPLIVTPTFVSHDGCPLALPRGKQDGMGTRRH